MSNTPGSCCSTRRSGMRRPVRAPRARAGAGPDAAVEAARRHVGGGVPCTRISAGGAPQLPGAARVVARTRRGDSAGRRTGAPVRASRTWVRALACSTQRSSPGSTGTICGRRRPARAAGCSSRSCSERGSLGRGTARAGVVASSCRSLPGRSIGTRRAPERCGAVRFRRRAALSREEVRAEFVTPAARQSSTRSGRGAAKLARPRRSGAFRALALPRPRADAAEGPGGVSSRPRGR